MGCDNIDLYFPYEIILNAMYFNDMGTVLLLSG